MFWYLITVGDKLHSFCFQTEPRRSPRHAENAMALEENTFRDLEAEKNRDSMGTTPEMQISA